MTLALAPCWSYPSPPRSCPGLHGERRLKGGRRKVVKQRAGGRCLIFAFLCTVHLFTLEFAIKRDVHLVLTTAPACPVVLFTLRAPKPSAQTGPRAESKSITWGPPASVGLGLSHTCISISTVCQCSDSCGFPWPHQQHEPHPSLPITHSLWVWVTLQMFFGSEMGRKS